MATKKATKSSKSSAKREHRQELSLPQVRVLRELAKAGGPLSRTTISDRCKNKTTVVVGRAVGYSDPAKRKAFENSKDGGFRPSLLTSGYVEEVELDVDGEKQTAIKITATGRTAFKRNFEGKLPALRD